MENNTLDKLAKRIIEQNMKKVIIEKPNLSDKDDIKLETQLKIMLPLTYEEEDKEKARINEKMQQELLGILEIFDKTFDKIYEEYVEKETEKSSKEKALKEELKELEISDDVKKSSLNLSKIVRRVKEKLPKNIVKELGKNAPENIQNDKKKEFDAITMYHGQWRKNAPQSKDDLER